MLDTYLQFICYVRDSPYISCHFRMDTDRCVRVPFALQWVSCGARVCRLMRRQQLRGRQPRRVSRAMW